MHVDNIWRKGRNYKGKEKSFGHYKESEGKGNTGAKVATKDLTKAGGDNKGKKKGYSGPKSLGSSKGCIFPTSRTTSGS